MRVAQRNQLDRVARRVRSLDDRLDHGPDPRRAARWNAPMVEGWAAQVEEPMVKAGGGGEKNDRDGFVALEGHRTLATSAILDLGSEAGEMRGVEAVSFRIEKGSRERAAVGEKPVRAKPGSTDLGPHSLRFAEIRALERDHWRAPEGERFRQRAFNEAILGRGSLAVRYLRRGRPGAPAVR